MNGNALWKTSLWVITHPIHTFPYSRPLSMAHSYVMLPFSLLGWLHLVSSCSYCCQGLVLNLSPRTKAGDNPKSVTTDKGSSLPAFHGHQHLRWVWHSWSYPTEIDLFSSAAALDSQSPLFTLLCLIPVAAI